jgi:hypothetical protein
MLRAGGELYKPVAALLTEMTAELAALEKSAEPVRRAEESVWATPEQVEAALGGLPTGPDLAAVVNAHLAGRPAGDRERALQEAAGRRIEARRAERAADWERLTGVIPVVRRNPGAVRTADLDVFRAHWFELLAPLQEEAERLRAELAAE